ncbi:DUF2000 domain-containing protein [Mycetocola zhadangensis]|uniref:DUF2000 domain-containing protein n=1 Tax=Mycetocola zhadangensis TaxID=1164595 RepID=UPI003A4E2838
MTQHSPRTIGFADDEIQTGESTRNARLKWVVIVDASLPAGRQVNAAVCVAAATAAEVTGILGPGGVDAAEGTHPGLPWAGCSILSATADELAAIREKAANAEDMFLADMPAAAQETRVYDEYLAELATTAPENLRAFALSIVGPKNAVARLVKKLPLLA